MILIATILISTIFLDQKVKAETFDAINVDNFSGNNMCITSNYDASGCSPASRNIPFFYSYEIVSDNFTKLFYFDSNQKEYILPTGASYAIVPVYIKSNEDFKFVYDYQASNKQITSNMIDFNLSIWNSTSNGSKWFTCDLLQHDDNSNYYYYRCPVQGNIHAIRTSVNFIYANTNLVQTVPTIKVGIGELWSLALDNSSSIEAALNQSKQNTEDIKNEISKEHEYNNNASKDTTEQENEINNYEQQEDSLRNSLNLDIEESEITINPNANNFIWDTINKLRGMSSKIVLLFTSVLSLGLMKMILGR